MAEIELNRSQRPWTKLLSDVPDVTFGWVEAFCRSDAKLPKSHERKGWNFYIGGFIDWEHLEFMRKDGSECIIRGTCYRSMKKNESPHQLKVR